MAEISVRRPKRWDVPFSQVLRDDADSAAGAQGIGDDDVDRILQMEPFCQIAAAAKFPRNQPLRAIIKNDARLVCRSKGGLVVRFGDWGNSAFFILKGTVKVKLDDEQNRLPPKLLGQLETRRKSFFQAITQLWSHHKDPEVRRRSHFVGGQTGSVRSNDEESVIYLQDMPVVLDATHATKMLGPGEFFGELAALGRTQRTATVVADEDDTELLEMRWQGLRDIMKHADDFQRIVDEAFRERGLNSFLRGLPIFRHLYKEQDQEAIKQLKQQAEFVSFGRYDQVDTFKELVRKGAQTEFQHEPFIEKEGDFPNGVIFIRSGLVRLSLRHHHGHRTVGYLTPGQMFGFEEMLQGWRGPAPVAYQYSARAIGYVTVVRVPTRLIEKLVLERLYDKGDPVPSDSSTPLPQKSGSQIDPGLLEFLSERRFINGTATMMIDLDRCTRCDDCVRACAATHDNNPRFLRHGPVHGRYMLANACMHCQDPVCMIDCPTGAIHRDLAEGQVIINDRTCIGCSRCYNNCPYDAIRMVEVRDEQCQLIFDSVTHAPIEKATKCDLCADQMKLVAPACQNACPHDALQRVDMTDVNYVADWLNR